MPPKTRPAAARPAKAKPVKLNLNKRTIEGIEPPASGRIYLYDSAQSGLCLCVLASGVKTWYRGGRINGRAVRVKLGAWPDVTTENARKAARAVAGDVAKGIDPTRKRPSTPTLQALFDHWLAYAKQRKKTYADDEAKWRYAFGPLKNRRITEITAADVTKWHSKLGAERGTYIANRCRALLSAMFNKAHELGVNVVNPCIGCKRFKEESRERFLQPAELRPLFEALAAEPPAWRDFWLLCLYTGARRGAVASMAWGDLDLERGIWYIGAADSKNGKPLAIVLSGPAVTILQARMAERKPDGKFVFPSERGDSGYIRDPRKSWARVLATSGIENLHPHDLRRSLGSWQAIGGASLQIIGASLGHRDPKATAVYSRLLMAPVRASVDGAVEAMIAAATPEGAADGSK